MLQKWARNSIGGPIVLEPKILHSIVANNEYTVKISNPTDEEHELIIDSKIDGETSEVVKSRDIEPGNIVEFKFKVEEARGLGYHCEYHPDIMKGTITVFAPSQNQLSTVKLVLEFYVHSHQNVKKTFLASRACMPWPLLY